MLLNMVAATKQKEYKFHVSCPCGSYVAKPKMRFTGPVLLYSHLDEIKGMLRQHQSSTSCGYTDTVKEEDIWCYEDGEGCPWVYEKNTAEVAARPQWAVPTAGSGARITRSRSMHPMRNRSRSPPPVRRPIALNEVNAWQPPVRPPITMSEVNAWLSSRNRTIQELASINAFTAQALLEHTWC